MKIKIKNKKVPEMSNFLVAKLLNDHVNQRVQIGLLTPDGRGAALGQRRVDGVESSARGPTKEKLRF